MLLGFPKHALFLVLDDAFVWSFETEFSIISNSVRALVQPPVVFPESVHLACFMTFLRGLSTQNVVLM